MPTSPSGPSYPVAWIALTIDCGSDEDVQEQLRQFYAAALGGEIVAGSVRARGLLLNFSPMPDYRRPTWPSEETPKQMHFEWTVDDLEGAVERLQQLGATLSEHQNPKDPELRVLLDPVGHPFCVMTTTSVLPEFRDEASFQQR